MHDHLKIAFCTDGVFPHSVGGMQRHSRLLIEALAQLEVDLTVLHPHKEKIFAAYSNVKEIHLEDIDKNKFYLSECYDYSKRVFAHLSQMPEHIIYTQGLSVWYGIKNLPNPIIINPHGLEPYQALTSRDKLTAIPYKRIFNYLFKQSTYVISLGGKLTDILKQHIKKTDKIIELPNGINLPKGQLPSRKKNEVLKCFFVGRFASNKGIALLLEVIRELNEEGYEKQFYFNLGGKGPLFNTLKESFSDLQNVCFHGFVSDEHLVELYRDNDLFVFPTLFEGMPTVVLEAMSFGLPIIVTDVGATAKLVDPANGFLIPRNNKIELKTALLKMLNLSDTEYQTLSKNSRAKVEEQFTWKKIADSHVTVFKQLTLIPLEPASA